MAILIPGLELYPNVRQSGTGSAGFVNNWLAFKRISEENEALYERIAGGELELKCQIPCYTPMSSRADRSEKRCESNAQPKANGCVYIDLDHVPEECILQFFDEVLALQESRVVDLLFLSRSVSGKGIHCCFVAPDSATSIKEAQAWFLEKMGNRYDEYYDKSVSNWSSLSFLENHRFVRLISKRYFI